MTAGAMTTTIGLSVYHSAVNNSSLACHELPKKLKSYMLQTTLTGAFDPYHMRVSSLFEGIHTFSIAVYT